MTASDRDLRETLTRIRRQVNAATDGPWAPWLDQDGTPHMNGLLMVGNADAVIPEGEFWVEDVDINPVAHTYLPEDREFIAHARTDVPWLLEQVERRDKALEAVLDLHKEDGRGWGPGESFCTECQQGYGLLVPYPCPTVTAIRQHIGDDL